MAEPGAQASRGASAWRLAVVGLVAFGFLAAKSCEQYVAEYQTFPSQDWLISTTAALSEGPPPEARDLARGFASVLPTLGVEAAPRPYSASFVPPGIYVRGIAGVLSAATTQKAAADQARDQPKVTARLAIVVFASRQQAAAWIALKTVQRDLARAAGGVPPQLRIASTSAGRPAWLVPDLAGETTAVQAATLGARGRVAYELLVEVVDPAAGTTSAGTLARAESTLRRAGSDWEGWLDQQGLPA